VCLLQRSLAHWWKVFVVINLVLPVVPTIPLLTKAEPHGYAPPFDTCDGSDSVTHMRPGAVLIFANLALVCCCWMGNLCRFCFGDKHSQRYARKLAFSAPLIFTTISSFTYLGIFFVRYNIVSVVEKVNSSGVLLHHIQCVFSNFDGIRDDSWISVCGEGIEQLKYAVSNRKYIIYLFNSQHILVILATLPLLFEESELVPRYDVQIESDGIVEAKRHEIGAASIPVVSTKSVSEKFLRFVPGSEAGRHHNKFRAVHCDDTPPTGFPRFIPGSSTAAVDGD
jgi:hypothetical protein